MFQKKPFTSSHQSSNGLNYPMTKSITVNNLNVSISDYSSKIKGQNNSFNHKKQNSNMQNIHSSVNNNNCLFLGKDIKGTLYQSNVLKDNFLLSNSNFSRSQDKLNLSKTRKFEKSSSSKKCIKQTKQMTFSFNPINLSMERALNEGRNSKKYLQDQIQNKENFNSLKKIKSNSSAKNKNIDYVSSLNSLQFKIQRGSDRQISLNKSKNIGSNIQPKEQLISLSNKNVNLHNKQKPPNLQNNTLPNNFYNPHDKQKATPYIYQEIRSTKYNQKQFNSKKTTLSHQSKHCNESKPNSIHQTCQQNIKVSIRFKSTTSDDRHNVNHRNILNNPSQFSGVRLLNQQVILAQDKIYAFDRLFMKQNQEQIFQEVGKPVVNKLFQGFNGTIFAYGQTGSGKTHTIFGDIKKENQYGLIPRSIKQILHKRAQYQREQNHKSIKITCSFVQIYKQQLFDLFTFCQPKQTIKKPELKLKQNKQKGVYIQNLIQIQLQDQQQIYFVIQQALKYRRISSTKLNQKSSRSHTILTLAVHFQGFSTTLSLVDLAGSQKVNKSGVTGQSFEETKKINYSLSCLGNVINALTTRSNSDHIPFRDSKLTRLLKNSLSGKFITSIIITCSLDVNSNNQTISSLKFAQRAKRVRILPQNQIQINKSCKIIESQESTSRMADSLQYYQQKISQLSQELIMTKNQLNVYKMKQQEKINNSKICQNNAQNLKYGNRNQNHQQSQIITSRNDALLTNRSINFEDDLTARLPIPSQRACVHEKITKYTQKQIVPLYLGSKRQSIHGWDGLAQGESIQNLQSLKCSLKGIQGQLNNEQVDFPSQQSDQQQQTLIITQTKRYITRRKQSNQIQRQSQISFSFSVYKQEDSMSQIKMQGGKSNQRNIR